MANIPNSTASDRRTVSKQPYEIDSLVRVLQTEFKGKTHEEIARAIDMAMNPGSPTGSRVQISERARKILGAEARS